MCSTGSAWAPSTTGDTWAASSAALILGWLLCPFYQIEARPDGLRRVVDRNSLRAEWIGVALVAVLMVVAFWAALQHHLLNPMQGF